MVCMYTPQSTKNVKHKNRLPRLRRVWQFSRFLGIKIWQNIFKKSSSLVKLIWTFFVTDEHYKILLVNHFFVGLNYFYILLWNNTCNNFKPLQNCLNTNLCHVLFERFYSQSKICSYSNGKNLWVEFNLLARQNNESKNSWV